MGRVFACLVLILGGIAGQASACLNDSELPTHEREFRSQYPARMAGPPAIRRNQKLRYFVAGTGSVLLLAGVAVAVQGGRIRS